MDGVGVRRCVGRVVAAVCLWGLVAVGAGGAPSGALPYFSDDPEQNSTSYGDYRRGMERLFDNADRDDFALAVELMDADEDGEVSRDEYRDYVYAAADLDEDGDISQDERSNWEPPTHPQVLRQMLNCCDSDGDARVVKKEFMKVVHQFFEQLDWDRNRVLNSVETGDLPKLED